MFHYSLKRLTCLFGLILTVAVSPVQADDTEVYFKEGAVTGKPMVMFYLEYTPNLASTVCTGVTEDNIASSCPAIDPVKLYMSDNDLDDSTIDQFELTRAALKRVLAPLGGLEVGILMGHNNNNNCAGPTETGCSAGAYILKGLTLLANVPSIFDPSTNPFDPDNESHLTTLLTEDAQKKAVFDKLDSLRSPHGGYSHPNQLKENYFELFRYLTGQGIYNGHNGWQDFATSGSYNLGDRISSAAKKYPYSCSVADGCATVTSVDEYTSTPNAGPYDGDFSPLENGNYVSTIGFKWDESVESAGNYISPLENCSKIFVINVVDGGGTSQNDADTAIEASLASGGMAFNVDNNDPGFVQMVRWLHDKDLADGSINGLDLSDKQNVVSFFIAKQPQQLDAAASAGGTGLAIPLEDDAQSVVDAIEKVLNSVISVSTTFVSASIPVNVFNRSEVIDNAYIALFQANVDKQPFWVGNIKKLKLNVYEFCNVYDTDGVTCLDAEKKLQLIDALNQMAVSSTDGRIEAHARTFWTKANGYDLADNIDPDTEVAPVGSSGVDGRSVHRGGAGQQIPGFLSSSDADADGFLDGGVVNWDNSTTGRKLLTQSGANLIDISYANLTTLWPSLYGTGSSWPAVYNFDGSAASISGVYSTDRALLTQDPTASFKLVPCLPSMKESYESGLPYACYSGQYFDVERLAANLIGYIRGFDVKDSDGDGIIWETRRWAFGDPLHSRPLPINYGLRTGYTEENPDIRLIAGSNDGFLRMIKNTDPGDPVASTDPDATKKIYPESGKEVWAFMPREVMKIQKQLMDNAANGSPIHPYGLDGAVTAYVQDTDGTITAGETTATGGDADGVIDRAWIYFGLRRGGRSYYAMDVTDPDNPKFKWHIDQNSAGFSEMGYTFGQPVVRELDWGSGTKPVVIVSGGYDLNKDIETPALGTNDSMGNAIYIIDADTGALVWKVTGSGTSSTDTFVHTDMVDSIPSDVTAIDSDNDGKVDRVYVGDTGGSVWRLDMIGSDRSNWRATRILNIGRHYANDVPNDRRFFHAPDIVPARDTTGVYYAVVIGSGNRAHPLQLETQDAMYMYKDRVNGTALSDSFTTLTPDNLFNATNNCLQEVDVACNTTTDTDTSKLSKGWFMTLTEQGEKSLASALTLRGRIYFSTYIPYGSSSDATACGPGEGVGYLYDIYLRDATAAYNYDTSNTAYDGDKEFTLQIEDRKRELLSPGIPSENVYVSYEGYSGILASDLQAGQNLGAQQWHTYWFEKQK